MEDYTQNGITMSTNKKMDCTKITSLEEVKLILDCLNLYISSDAPHFEKLKHLIINE
jgi:hypothetical protein